MDYYDIADLAAELTESGLIFENDFTDIVREVGRFFFGFG